MKGGVVDNMVLWLRLVVRVLASVFACVVVVVEGVSLSSCLAKDIRLFEKKILCDRFPLIRDLLSDLGRR